MSNVAELAAALIVVGDDFLSVSESAVTTRRPDGGLDLHTTEGEFRASFGADARMRIDDTGRSCLLVPLTLRATTSPSRRTAIGDDDWI